MPLTAPGVVRMAYLFLFKVRKHHRIGHRHLYVGGFQQVINEGLLVATGLVKGAGRDTLLGIAIESQPISTLKPFSTFHL